MKVLIDGDSLVYTIGFASQKNIWQVYDVDQPELIHYENESKPLCLSYIEDQEGSLGVLDVCRRIEVSPVEHAFHSLKVIIQKIAQRAKANSYKIYLTGKGNFRNDVATIMGYKHNRLDAEKPALYQEIRDYLVQHHKATVVTGMEADDALSIVHARSVSGDPINVSNDPNHPVYRHPDECIIAAIDKDLRNIPGKHINFDKRVAENDEYKFIVISEEEGRRAFWKQVLTGDSSDNILGIPGMGPKKADAVLDAVTSQSEEDYFWAVYGEYKRVFGTEPFEYLRYDAYKDTTATYRKREEKDAADIEPSQRLVGTALTHLLENARLLWMLREAPNAEGTHWWMPPLSFEAIAIEDEAQAWADQGMKEEAEKQKAQGFTSTELKSLSDYEDKGFDKPWSEGRGKWYAVTNERVPILIGPVGTKKKCEAAIKDLADTLSGDNRTQVGDAEEATGWVDGGPGGEPSEDDQFIEGTGCISKKIADLPASPVNQMWGFWDETWATWYGPYNTQEEAQAACDAYAATLGPDFPDGTDAEGFPGGDERMSTNDVGDITNESGEVAEGDELVTEPVNDNTDQQGKSEIWDESFA